MWKYYLHVCKKAVNNLNKEKRMDNSSKILMEDKNRYLPVANFHPIDALTGTLQAHKRLSKTPENLKNKRIQEQRKKEPTKTPCCSSGGLALLEYSVFLEPSHFVHHLLGIKNCCGRKLTIIWLKLCIK